MHATNDVDDADADTDAEDEQWDRWTTRGIWAVKSKMKNEQ